MVSQFALTGCCPGKEHRIHSAFLTRTPHHNYIAPNAIQCYILTYYVLVWKNNLTLRLCMRRHPTLLALTSLGHRKQMLLQSLRHVSHNKTLEIRD